MPLTKAQSLLISNDELLAHLQENAANRIQLAERLPFFPINGDALRVERVDAANLGLDPTLDDDTAAPQATTVGQAVPQTSLEVSFSLKLIVQDVAVGDTAQYARSNVNSQVGVQLELATRRMLYVFWKKFGNGNQAASPGEFNGLVNLVTAGQTISAFDSATRFMTLDDIARLVNKVTANNGRPHALWGPATAYKNVLKAYYDRGLSPPFVTVKVPDSNGGFVERQQLCVDGDIPVYKDEFYSTTENVSPFSGDGTSLYAMVLGRGGVYGIVPAGFGQKMIRVKEVLAASTAQTTYRLYWPVGLVLEKQDALARLQFRPQPSTA